MNERVVIGKNLRRYRRKFIILAIVMGLITLLLSALSIVKIVETVKSIKKLQGLIESNFSKPEEALEFENGNFSIVLPDEIFNYIVKATINKNVSKELPLKGIKPYEMEGFESNIYKLPIELNPESYKEAWVDYMKINSNFISLTKNNLTIYGEVKGFFDTKQNPKLKNTLAFATSINLNLTNKLASGTDLLIKNPVEGKFSAGTFEFFTEKGTANFKNGVLFENSDYKITSETLDALMKDGKVQNMLFQKNVKFYEKGEKGTVVSGDNAFYDYAKNEIKLYGNVIITSTTNNLQIKSETFTYNEKTKLGYFEGSQSETQEKSKINVSIDI